MHRSKKQIVKVDPLKSLGDTMKQEITQTNIGSQAAKEREAIRQLSRGCLYLTLFLIILTALILYLVLS